MKNKTNKIFAISLVLLLSLTFVMAQNVELEFQQGGNVTQQELEQHRNMFEEKHQNFICEGECTYGENIRNQVTLQVREQKRFLFWNVDTEEDYVLDEEGEIIEARYNFWSRILNRARLRVDE